MLNPIPPQPDLERELRDLLGARVPFGEAVRRLHHDQGVGLILLARAVSRALDVPLVEARHAVLLHLGLISPTPRAPESDEEVNRFPFSHVRVLEALEQRSSLWSSGSPPDVAFRAAYFPAFDDPLLLSVVLYPSPVLRAVTAEAFNCTHEVDRVSVARWPVPISANHDLHHWSQQADLPRTLVARLQTLAERFSTASIVDARAVGLDGIDLVGMIRTDDHVQQLRGWSIDPQEAPELHAFFTTLLEVASVALPPGHVHQVVHACRRYL